jgi:beta-lactamase superfamily II metal-dependent hydrolase
MEKVAMPRYSMRTNLTLLMIAEIAVISCGYHNSYGHPHKEVVERLSSSDAKVFRTDLHGAVVVKCNGRRGVVARGWRKYPRE